MKASTSAYDTSETLLASSFMSAFSRLADMRHRTRVPCLTHRGSPDC